MISKGKILFIRLVLVAASCAITLLLLEVVLRLREAQAMKAQLADQSKAIFAPSDIPGLYYTLKPGAGYAGHHFNSHGFNMPERPVKKPDGIWRIMVVGDSFTEGVGSKSLEEAFPNRTEKLLRERLNRDDIEVWNCGTGGYNVDQVFLMLSRVVTNYSPNAVIYGFCFNDNWGPNYYLQGQAAQPQGAEAMANHQVRVLDMIKKSRVVMLIKSAYDTVHFKIKGYLPIYVDYKIGYPSWQAMKERIVEMSKFCKAHGWPFMVSLAPFPQFIYVDDSRNLALHDIRSFLEKEQIPFVDATPILREHNKEQLFSILDNHPNGRGYQLIAENLTAWIQTNGVHFLPAKKP